jgi:hypothetical protein
LTAESWLRKLTFLATPPDGLFGQPHGSSSPYTLPEMAKVTWAGWDCRLQAVNRPNNITANDKSVRFIYLYPFFD